MLLNILLVTALVAAAAAWLLCIETTGVNLENIGGGVAHAARRSVNRRSCLPPHASTNKEAPLGADQSTAHKRAAPVRKVMRLFELRLGAVLSFRRVTPALCGLLQASPIPRAPAPPIQTPLVFISKNVPTGV
jgi:hypothetical protein